MIKSFIEGIMDGGRGEKREKGGGGRKRREEQKRRSRVNREREGEGGFSTLYIHVSIYRDQKALYLPLFESADIRFV
jgi:hypothetical protein